jgi:hypothetical protein
MKHNNVNTGLFEFIQEKTPAIPGFFSWTFSVANCLSLHDDFVGTNRRSLFQRPHCAKA